ncbi:MAG: hypothetical protein ACRDOU_08240 [Streptosporangiaceae bacterium]
MAWRAFDRDGRRSAMRPPAGPLPHTLEDSDDGAAVQDQPPLEYACDVIEVVETYLYRPGLRVFGSVVTAAKRLQSGRLNAYLLCMLIVLLAVIAVVTAVPDAYPDVSAVEGLAASSPCYFAGGTNAVTPANGPYQAYTAQVGGWRGCRTAAELW